MDSLSRDLCSDSEIHRVLIVLWGSTFGILATLPRKKKTFELRVGGEAVSSTKREHWEDRANEQRHESRKLLDEWEESEAVWSPGDKLGRRGD